MYPICFHGIVRRHSCLLSGHGKYNFSVPVPVWHSILPVCEVMSLF